MSSCAWRPSKTRRIRRAAGWRHSGCRRYEHSREIRDAYGYRDFHGVKVAEPLGESMSARVWTHAEGAVALFRQSAAWLCRGRVLLSGVSVSTRLVATVRTEADKRALSAALARAAEL